MQKLCSNSRNADPIKSLLNYNGIHTQVPVFLSLSGIILEILS